MSDNSDDIYRENFNREKYINLAKNTEHEIHCKSNKNISKIELNIIKTEQNKSTKNSSSEEEPELFFAVIETINPINEKYNKNAIYNIKIQSSLDCNNSWYKKCTLDELIYFRNYLMLHIKSVINLPFPSKSLFRFLPYIGNKYDERNWDILLENKFLLDNFFSTICKDPEMYKLSGFIDFFTKPDYK